MVPRLFLVAPAIGKYTMKKLLALLLVTLANFSYAKQPDPLPLDSCKQHVPYGFPIINTKKETSSHICRTGYFVVHDDVAKIPRYTAYVLTPQEVLGCLPRSSTFSTDNSLPVEDAASPRDYLKSGYDMGHIANSGDMRWNEQAEDESFILSNAAPQLPEFNRGIWKKLEDTTRGWVISRENPVLIYSGTIYSTKDKTIGDGVVKVPNAFFKILIDTKTQEVQAFLLKHEGSKKPLSAFIVSVSTIQAKTGIKFPLPAPRHYNGIWPIEVKTATKAKAEVCTN